MASLTSSLTSPHSALGHQVTSLAQAAAQVTRHCLIIFRMPLAQNWCALREDKHAQKQGQPEAHASAHVQPDAAHMRLQLQLEAAQAEITRLTAFAEASRPFGKKLHRDVDAQREREREREDDRREAERARERENRGREQDRESERARERAELESLRERERQRALSSLPRSYGTDNHVMQANLNNFPFLFSYR